MTPYLAAKLCAELPVGAFFPLAFGAVVYPMAGLHPRLDRFAKFAGLIVLESFTSSAIGLAVSSVAPSTEAAVAMGPAVMVLFIVFGGYYVNADNVPVCFRWINKCSLIKWAFQGLCVNEFAGLEFERAEKVRRSERRGRGARAPRFRRHQRGGRRARAGERGVVLLPAHALPVGEKRAKVSVHGAVSKC